MTWKGRPSSRKERLRAAGVSGWDEQRQAKRVLERDGHRCYLRGPDCIGTATQVDHVIPLFKGGSKDDDNVRAICHECHRAKVKRETAQARNRYRMRREPEPHPGLLDQPRAVIDRDEPHPGLR